ncbi:MAG TPA: ATP-binding protein [Cyclobacteriaceae bacterium]|nr:ATP-binding protein [Cyclobacteriaceae bacterium]
MTKILPLLLISLLPLKAVAQDYFFKQYRVENGLPSDIVKACAQDSLGYFWMATDDGLVKYDGIKFTTFREAMHNNYAKGFLATRSGRLLAYGDLDFLEIKNLGDTVVFESVLPVSRNPTANSLTYPKFVYEDLHGNIWVSESQSVVKMKKENFTRYSFDLANRSPQFLRSFAYFEDKAQQLFISSFQGNVFLFDPLKDSFSLQSEKLPNEIEFVSTFNGKLIIGSSSGLYESDLLESGGFSAPKLKFKINNVSYVAHVRGTQYFIATRDLQHYIADFDKNVFSTISNRITNVNHGYVSKEGDLWLSGNDGLILIKEKSIQEASEHINNFIESIAEDPVTGEIYYATSTTLFSYNAATKKNRIEQVIPSGYFQSILFSNDEMWVANAFKVSLYKSKKLVKQFDFSRDARFISDMIKDVRGNVWLAQSGNPDVYMLDADRQLTRVKIPLGSEGTINMVYEGNGGVFVASTGKNSYLFHKPYDATEFQNISKPVTFVTHADFGVTDMAIYDNTIWLASSEGLLKMDDHKIERVDLGATFSALPVKSITVYSPHELLLSNAYGMLLYNTSRGTYDLFNESSGLLSNTVTPRGLFISRTGSVWIGTSKGLCFTTRSLTDLQKTPTPRFTDTHVNGKHVQLNPRQEIEYGSFISIQVSSITFPEKEVALQYQLSPDTIWRNANGTEITFSSLRAGSYSLNVRSKKNGSYSWSATANLTFKIAKPFWQQSWFIFASFVAASSLVVITVVWANARNKIRNKELQLLIAERTSELKLINEELELRNAELDRFVYSASHDLSAPLKSILGLINVAKMEKSIDAMENYLDLMKRSILKLESFIKDIISYSRNTRLEVKKELIDFDAMIQSVWADLLFTPDAAKIKFQSTNELRSEIRSDETRLRIVFNNLLSNAVKFRKADTDSYIKVIASEAPDWYEFVVEDNGIGISSEYKEKIFDMFFRANERAQGSGLGLYILKETLSRLNGTVKVESVLGQGSKFIIGLPK